MSILLTVIVTFFAGMGAGLGTGFAGMSAAATARPGGTGIGSARLIPVWAR